MSATGPGDGSTLSEDGSKPHRPSIPSMGSRATGSTLTPRASSAAPLSAPLIQSAADTDDPRVPEVTHAVGHSQNGASSSVSVAITAPLGSSNLAPRDESFVGQRLANIPHGSETDALVGLTSAEAAVRLAQWGRNEIPEEKTPWFIMLGKQFVGMMPLMLEIAAVLSALIRDAADFSIIVFMLVVNAMIGFHEERKAQQSLDALKSQMTVTVPVKRDGAMVIHPVAELVPGDVIFLRGGNVVPADCEWLEGDPMLVDTAALTGEPIPRKVPRPESAGEDPGAGRRLLAGCIIKQGEGHCEVKETGLRTEIGQAAGMVAEASGHTMGVFESKILQVVRAVILISLVDAGVVLYVDVAVRKNSFSESLLGTLALIIGAVPIALPLVMQVTMAMGAATMASKKAIVTHLTALQEIASMTVLCSDKTGTLTTADMRVMPNKIWTRDGHSKDNVLAWAGVASNPANKEDPIDKSVLSSVVEHFGENAAELELSKYRKNQFVGFNPTVKRTVAYCSHPSYGDMKISKGLLSKVLATGDDGGDCWECEDLENIREEVEEVDVQFSTQGYKTVGVALAHKTLKGDYNMRLVGIVPMLDPPRSDTRLTIHRIRLGGIAVKMVTGDHLNIAIETSRLIGMGTNILPNTELWPASAGRDELVVTSDGFAQVLPRDKREVVLVLQNRGLVVGMTGDGVNDAPALAQAQIGIAVDDATEAARSAADIILTSPGLSAIFDAVMESRRIFARLRAYVLYRVAATIQIVVVLSILIYGYNDPMPPLLVILLALLNDVSMLPIASDRASPSAMPEIPSMPDILLASTIYGMLESAQTMVFYNLKWFKGDGTPDYRHATLYLQISMAIEMLIFSCRTPGFVLLGWKGTARPSAALFFAVMCSNVLVSLLAAFGDTFKIIYKVGWVDIAWIWLYDICGLIIVDLFKCLLAAAKLPWMSAGAASGVLEYADLPADPPAGSVRSTVLGGQRSTFAGRQVSVTSSVRGSTAGSGGPAVAPQERLSRSLLPYPHNLRADLSRSMRSQ